MSVLELVQTDPIVLLTLVVLAGVLGLVIGSFLNVVIYRVPRGLSIAHPPSACPQCHTPIAPRDNIPVLSWLLLRGRCRKCAEPISARYPLVEAGTGLAFAATAALLLPSDLIGLLPLALTLVAFGIALALIDLDVHRLPNALVLPLYPITVIGLVLAGAVEGSGARVTGALAGAGVWLLVIGGIWLATGGRGMGFGDVKLAPVLGAFTGWVGFGAAVVGLLIAFVAGSVVPLMLVAARRARASAPAVPAPAGTAGRTGLRGMHIAFGPFLLLGAAVGAVSGSAIATWYIGFAVGGG